MVLKLSKAWCQKKTFWAPKSFFWGPRKKKLFWAQKVFFWHLKAPIFWGIAGCRLESLRHSTQSHGCNRENLANLAANERLSKKNFFPGKNFFLHKPTFHHFKTTSQFIHKFSLQMSWLIATVWICHYEDLFTYFDLDYEVSNFGFWFRHEGAISGKWCCTRGRRGRKYYILARIT